MSASDPNLHEHTQVFEIACTNELSSSSLTETLSVTFNHGCADELEAGLPEADDVIVPVGS